MTDHDAALRARGARYMPALDGVRGICMLAVLIGHLTIFGGAGLFFQPRMISLLGGGELCLEVFFVLSGALITHLALCEIAKTGTVDMRKFRMRRVRRLAPAAVMILLTTTALCVAGLRDDSLPLGTRPTLVVLSVLALSSNWLLFNHANLGYLAPTWSLSVEEQFYLAWPLTLRRTWTRLGAAGSAMAALALLVIGFDVAVLTSTRGVSATYSTPVAGIGLLCGCLVAIWLHSPWASALRKVVWATPVAAVLAFGIGFSARWLHFHQYRAMRGGYLFFGVVTALFIGHLMIRSTRPSLVSRALGIRPLAFLGRISYGAYLFHATIYQMWARSGLIPNIEVRGVVDVTSALVVASISYRFVEEPIRLGKLRLPRRRRATTARATRPAPAPAWARLRFVPQLALGVAAVVVVLQFAPAFHPSPPAPGKAEVAASGLVPACTTTDLQAAAGISGPGAVVACDGQWALAASNREHGRMELLHYRAGSWRRLNTRHGALLDSAVTAHVPTASAPRLTVVQHLAAAVGPVAQPAAAAATLIAAVATTAKEANLPAVVASPVVARNGQRWLAVLSPASAGPAGRMTIYEWRQQRWTAVGLVTGIPAAPETTYRISVSTLAGTLDPAWVLHAVGKATVSVGVVTDLGGSWHLVNLSAPGASGLLTKVGGLVPGTP
ncbi:MAG TPA: acyltransferase [Mycobacteriales bacterium]|nr:acyltransferase [Mycobacteriales bacterium]HWB67204.1 acyltransferase [Mycobacteriales bacterium]